MTTNRFSPLSSDSDDEEPMEWQDDTKRQVNDAKPMEDDITTTQTDDKPTRRPKTAPDNTMTSHQTTSHVDADRLSIKSKRKVFNVQILSPTLQLNKKDKMLYVPLQFAIYENHALLDTGAVQSALSEAELRKITAALPEAILEELPPPDFKIQIANGSLVPVRKQVVLRFFLAVAKCLKKGFQFYQLWERYS